jgi:response regulator of citrate/malate metabolism
VQPSVQTQPNQLDAQIAQVDANLASELIASGVTTQSVETVIAVLTASRNGASINAAAKKSGINYRTAQRIVEATNDCLPRHLASAG